MRKVCTKCGVEKDFDEFHNRKETKNGKYSKCKECAELYRKKYYEANSEKYAVWRKKYAEANKEKLLAKGKKYYAANREHYKEYRETNKGKISVCRKKCYEANKEKYLAQKKKYYEANRENWKEYREANRERINCITNKRRMYRRKYDLNFKIQSTIGSRIRTAIKKGYKRTRSMELLGCTIEELKIHLESQFQLFMNWDNHGLYGWHIDHIVPCNAFDLTDIEQQKLCFHYTNLQPLWAKDNLRKKDKLEWEML